MSKVRACHSTQFYRIAERLRHAGPYLFIPVALTAIASFIAFRQQAIVSLPNMVLSDSLQLPAGWPAPPIPADNPITSAKFVLGRQLFYETKLSGDDSTSCASCHQQKYSFASPTFPKSGAFGNLNNPVRRVPRIVNVGYDSVLFWDGHAASLEQQAQLAVLGHGDLDVTDTTSVFKKLSDNPAYGALFTQAFGSSTITLDRVAKAIATFERCLISGNSPYDQYLKGKTSALSASAIRGMNLFFDTANHCSDCHNSLGSQNPNASGNEFTDCNYYRTGTFEPPGGYGGPDSNEDVGREIVTRDSLDLGKFRTPTLRNVSLTPPYGADGTVKSLSGVIANYNNGGIDTLVNRIFFNLDPRIRPLKLTQQNQSDIVAFLQSLTDSTFITNPDFQNPGPLSISVVEDGHIISGNVAVYPNPASSFVNVECPDLTGAAEASLISEGGVTVWRRMLHADGRPFQLDFTGIANGVYRLELNAGEVQRAVNIVLKR